MKIENIYHLSNLIGIKYDVLKEILECADDYYEEIVVRQKNRKIRHIQIPNFELRFIQNYILEYILPKREPNVRSCAFQKNKSIKTHAGFHEKSDWSVNVDLKDFFSSINIWLVYDVFMNNYNFDKSMALVLAKLCCFDERLPQGAPTSPYLSNIVFLELDERFYMHFSSLGLIYSRYGDDITISGAAGNYVNKLDIVAYISNNVKQYGFQLNERKTKYYRENLKITGLLVSKGVVLIPQKYIREVTSDLYYWRKYGLNVHLNRKYDFEKNKEVYISEIIGKLLWIRNINMNQFNLIFSQYKDVLNEFFHFNESVK